MDSLETLARRLTTAINGQYPRPWMTDLTNPAEAEVFVVGYNPATAYEVGTVKYERHLNALFNRNGESCRRFYAELTPGTPSRDNIEMFTQKLAQTGVVSVIETNVVCYATKSKSDLSKPEHAGGEERGIEIFRALIGEIRPKAIVVHGKGVSEKFRKALNLPPSFPSPPDSPDRFATYDVPQGARVFVIPSLALPGFQNWPKAPLRSFCNWADEYLTRVAANVAHTVHAAQPCNVPERQ